MSAHSSLVDRLTVLVPGYLPPPALDALREHFSVLQIADLSQLATLDVSVRSSIRGVAEIATVGVNDAMLDQLPAVEIVSLFGVGLDAVDLAAARRRSVAVSNTPGVLTDDTADYAIALVFALARRIAEGDRFVRRGDWGTEVFPNGWRIRGRKLGIVGLGRIGRATADRAHALAMDVHWTGPRPKPEVPYVYHATVADLAKAVDFLVLTCPGGRETDGIVDHSVLSALGPEGFLINISRGTVVDEAAVVDALVSGAIAGAALDVFRAEPAVPAELLDLDNVILEPHIASTTAETRREIGQLMVRNLLDYFAGRPLGDRAVHIPASRRSTPPQ